MLERSHTIPTNNHCLVCVGIAQKQNQKQSERLINSVTQRFHSVWVNGAAILYVSDEVVSRELRLERTDTRLFHQLHNRLVVNHLCNHQNGPYPLKQ